MPLDESQIWTLQSASERVSLLRTDLDDELGVALDYEYTIDGAWTLAVAEYGFDVDQGGALLLSSIFLDSAPASVVVARAVDAGLTPRPAIAERVLATVSSTSYPVTIPGTTKWLDDEGRQWSPLNAHVLDTGAAIAANADGGYTLPDDAFVEIQCDEVGAISYTGVDLSPSISGVTIGATAVDDALVMQLGADAESTASLRARIRTANAAPSGSLTGLRAAVLDVPGVKAVSITGSAGSITVSVSAVVGFAQWLDVAQAIYDNAPAGATLTGTESATITGADGADVTVYWNAATTQAVQVDITVTSDSTVSVAELEESIETVVLQVFGRLTEGETVSWFRTYADFKLPGVDAVPTFELDSGTADITPTLSTSVLTASPINITVNT